MPVYEYVCIKCSERFEKFRSVGCRNRMPTCPECGFPARLVMSSPNLQENLGTRLRAKLDRKRAPDHD